MKKILSNVVEPLSTLSRHIIFRFSLVIGFFLLMSWPLISSWRPEAEGSVQCHLYFVWAALIVILYAMSRNDDEGTADKHAPPETGEA